MQGDPEILRSRARDMMPEVVADLKELVMHRSVAFPGYPPEPVHAMAQATADLLRRYGLAGARLVDIPGGYPAVCGEIPAPPGKPTILLYAHYDVQPAREEDGWVSDPWVPTVRDGRLYGRGASDDKAGILIAAAAIRAFGGSPPVGIRVLIEGEEEAVSHIGKLVESRPDLVACDAFVILDTSHIAVGNPALTTTMRGVVSCDITVSTLDHPVHSGSFGGAAPDALVALVRILSTLHTPSGEVAVRGLHAGPTRDGDYPEEIFRNNAGVLEGVSLAGTGPLAARLWSKPAISIIGIDAPSIASSSNSLVPRASARISMRIAPGADPRTELAILAGHLRAAAPGNARVAIRNRDESPGFTCGTGGTGMTMARRALELAFGKEPQDTGSGATIPLLTELRSAVPRAEFVLWGAGDDAGSRIHGTNESVDLGEVERMITALAFFLALMGETGNP
jgi:acetylornithine deacetylase/succinyl-diaminopimelate desuccinylase-like protein